MTAATAVPESACIALIGPDGVAIVPRRCSA